MKNLTVKHWIVRIKLVKLSMRLSMQQVGFTTDVNILIIDEKQFFPLYNIQAYMNAP